MGSEKSDDASTEATTVTSRLSAGERRELVLQAATRAFARSGYAATSTDAVAREAGVSQPYVVRIFGRKVDLFLEVFDRATARVMDAFAAVIDAGEVDPDSEEGLAPLGQAYTDLVLADRDVMQVMLHGFVAAGDPTIGAFARRRMAEIFAVVRRCGADDDRTRDFVAHGMLINVLLAMNAPENLTETPGLEPLAACALGEQVVQSLSA